MQGRDTMRQMTPAVARLVRLTVLLPGHDHPLWRSLTADCGDATEVMAMHWFVGDAAKTWPVAGPANLLVVRQVPLAGVPPRLVW